MMVAVNDDQIWLEAGEPNCVGEMVIYAAVIGVAVGATAISAAMITIAELRRLLRR